MAHVRRLPRLRGRFIYWQLPAILEPPPKGLVHLEGAARSQAIRQRPAARLDGETEADVMRGLEYRMRSDLGWASDSEAQKASAGLSRSAKAQLGRRVRCSGAHD